MTEITSLSVVAPGQLEFRTWDEQPQPGGFSARTVFSGISAGTESTFVRGDHPAFRKVWDWRNGMFTEGVPDIFPIPSLGYMEVAEVAESRRPDVPVGSLVAMSYGHRTGTEASSAQPATILPGWLDPVVGVFVATLGPIGANGLLHAAALDASSPSNLAEGVSGRNVMVLGAGAVGLVTAAFALHCGAAEVLVVDRDQGRLAVAAKFGAATACDADVDVVDQTKSTYWHGIGDAGVDVVFQTRPSAASLALGLRCARRGATVIDLAFYVGDAGGVRLGEEFHHNGLRLVSAQVDNLPRSAPGWDRARLSAETLDLLRHFGATFRDEVITSYCRFEDLPERLAAVVATSNDITCVVDFRL